MPSTRLQGGFDIDQMASEYRASCASDLRRLVPGVRVGTASHEDIVRFNEAIDQALAESLAFYATGTWVQLPHVEAPDR